MNILQARTWNHRWVICERSKTYTTFTSFASVSSFSFYRSWMTPKQNVHTFIVLTLSPTSKRFWNNPLSYIHFSKQDTKKHKNLCFTTEKTHFSLCKKTLHVKGGLIRIWVEFVFSNRKWMVQKGLVFSHYFFLSFVFSVLLLVIGQENLAIQVSFERKFVAY